MATAQQVSRCAWSHQMHARICVWDPRPRGRRSSLPSVLRTALPAQASCCRSLSSGGLSLVPISCPQVKPHIVCISSLDGWGREIRRLFRLKVSSSSLAGVATTRTVPRALDVRNMRAGHLPSPLAGCSAAAISHCYLSCLTTPMPWCATEFYEGVLWCLTGSVCACCCSPGHAVWAACDGRLL
jgi:hypothetical protein